MTAIGKTWALAVSAALVVTVTAAAPPVRAAGAVPLGALDPGRVLFRDDVVRARGDNVYDYALDVHAPPAGSRLRVALGAYQRGADAGPGTVELWAPGADQDGPPTASGTGNLDLEAFAGDPATGRWRVRVTMANTTGLHTGRTFTVRAALEPPAAAPADRSVLLLPNLEVDPPRDLNFLPCLTGWDQHGTPTPADECLRFAYGHENTGDGSFEVHFRPETDGLLAGVVTQRVYYADATPGDYRDNAAEDRFVDYPGAGRYELHPTHHHYHYQGLFAQHLYPVRADGSLGEPVEAAKRGLCGHDWFMAEMERVYQDPWDANDSDGCTGHVGTEVDHVRIALSAGWGDIYSSANPDNFVKFTGLPAGRYLLLMEVNPLGILRESDRTDNFGYALVDVTLDAAGRPTACVVERGKGRGPSDPRKTRYPTDTELQLCTASR